MGGCVSSQSVLVPAAGQPDEILLHVEPTRLLALYKEFNDHDDHKKGYLNEQQLQLLLNRRVYHARVERRIDCNGDLTQTGLVSGAFKYDQKEYTVDHEVVKSQLQSVFQQADAKHGRLTFRDFVAWQRRMTPEDATLGVVKDEEKMRRAAKTTMYQIIRRRMSSVWEGQEWQHDHKVIEALRVSDEVRRRPLTPRTPRNASPVVAPCEPHLPPPPMVSNEPKS